jgi:hypothetical protein
MHLPTVLPRSDTSTGSFTVCPTADLYKERKFCTTNQTGFTHRWFHANMQSFSMQLPTNYRGSVPFPEFALFTTLLRRVRLSQSGQWLADTINVAQRGYIMARDKTFRVRLTQQEFEKLESNAHQRQISSAELIRDYIKRLPNLLNSGVSNPVVSRGMSVCPDAHLSTDRARDLQPPEPTIS